MKSIVTQKEPSGGLRDVLIPLNLVPGSSLILASFLIGKEAISSVLLDQWSARGRFFSRVAALLCNIGSRKKTGRTREGEQGSWMRAAVSSTVLAYAKF